MRHGRHKVSFVDQGMSHRDQTPTHITHNIYFLVLSSNLDLEKCMTFLLTRLLAQAWARKEMSDEAGMWVEKYIWK